MASQYLFWNFTCKLFSDTQPLGGVGFHFPSPKDVGGVKLRARPDKGQQLRQSAAILRQYSSGNGRRSRAVSVLFKVDPCRIHLISTFISILSNYVSGSV